MNKQPSKKILDACCGGKMFWFNREHPDALYVDSRIMEKQIIYQTDKITREFEVKPDKVMDFRNLDLLDESFYLVVFDPPHLKTLGETSYMAKKYGRLNPETWRDDITKGLSECFRVLKTNGILIFKWNEYDIPLKEVLKLTPYQPLFGHPSGKLQKTHWVCFMKNGREEAWSA